MPHPRPFLVWGTGGVCPVARGESPGCPLTVENPRRQISRARSLAEEERSTAGFLGRSPRQLFSIARQGGSEVSTWVTVSSPRTTITPGVQSRSTPLRPSPFPRCHPRLSQSLALTVRGFKVLEDNAGVREFFRGVGPDVEVSPGTVGFGAARALESRVLVLVGGVVQG